MVKNTITKSLFNSLRLNIQQNRINLFFYIVVIIFLLFKFYYFNTELKCYPSTSIWTNIRFFVYTFTSCYVLTLPFILIKKKKEYYLFSLILLDIIFLSYTWYYRNYYTIMPITAMNQAENLTGLGPSILGSIKLKDSLFILSTILLLLTYYSYFRKRLNSIRIQERIRSFSIVSVFIVLIIILDFVQYYFEHGKWTNRFGTFYFDQCHGIKYFGFASCLLWQANNLAKYDAEIPPERLNEVEEWLNEHRTYTELNIDSSLFINKKNIILIIVESFESWAINSRYQGKEITPLLNELIAEEKSIFFPKVIPQTKDGRSSDTQFMINTGLFPINTGSVFFMYPENRYYSIVKALKMTDNYKAITLMGDEPSYWNQSMINPSLGYDELISSLNYDMTDQIGVGLSDDSFFDQSTDIISQLPQPFFLQMITLSSHTPFKLPKHKISIDFSDDTPEILNDYLTTIHYVDKSVGKFIHDLKTKDLFDNTAIIIMGDHEALRIDIRESLMSEPGIKDLTTQDAHLEEAYVPLVILNSNTSYVYKQPMGTIDVYPTLLDLLRINEYQWRGVGISIFNSKKEPCAINFRFEPEGITDSIPDLYLNHITSAWAISDLIVRSDYFK